MNKKRASYGALIGAGLLVAGLVLCPGKKQEKLQTPIQPVLQVQPVQQIRLLPRTYVVQKGDYLSGIIYNELGLRGRDIYSECSRIQRINSLGPERDISKVVNGKLVPGKDGFIDLLYVGEILKVR